MSLDVIIVMPALDEERAIPAVLASIPKEGEGFRVREVIVVDNGSRDGTAAAARAAGARVVPEPRRGYGSACQAGIREARAVPPAVLVILDADGSDDPSDLHAILAPLVRGTHDFVLGTRVARADPGALPPHVRAGNRLATFLIAATCGFRYTDMGPFRALAWPALEKLAMGDVNFGWNVEMQVKAVRRGLRVVEVPVRYRRRTGTSKISGTVSGTIRAGAKMVYSVFRYRFLG